jgi:hypothetical protein
MSQPSYASLSPPPTSKLGGCTTYFYLQEMKEVIELRVARDVDL